MHVILSIFFFASLSLHLLLCTLSMSVLILCICLYEFFIKIEDALIYYRQIEKIRSDYI